MSGNVGLCNAVIFFLFLFKCISEMVHGLLENIVEKSSLEFQCLYSVSVKLNIYDTLIAVIKVFI